MSHRSCQNTAGPTLVPRRAGRLLTVGIVLSLLVVFFPVEPLVAEPVAPEVVSETVEGLPEQVEAATGDASATRRSEVVEAPLRFTGLGVQGTGPEPELQVRTLGVDGEWSPWTEVEVLDEFEGPDPTSDEKRAAEAAVGPNTWTTAAVWAGEATHLQLESTGGRVGDMDVTFIDSMGLSETRLERIGRTLRSIKPAGGSSAQASSRPNIITRRQWGANESWRSGSPSYAKVRFGVLHHTAGSNTYSRAEASGQVRGIYYWHTQGNGWSDIGYNFLVDRFGRIYEGRYGGMQRGVIGAHSGGWNTGSFSVSLMGNHNNVGASSAARGAATDVFAWKYQLHGINPSPSARVRVNGYDIRTMEGHRNLRGGYTPYSSSSSFQQDCPGSYLYARMGAMRRSISSKVEDSSTAATVPAGWTPVTGDFDGDGRETAGWFRNGRWKLSNTTNNRSKADYDFWYGASGDVPVVGDWNADGTDTVGVFRNGRWYLRNRNSDGPPAARYGYGRAGDTPVVGDFNASGRDTVGVVRGSTWHLRLWGGSGPANVSFDYGRATDQPLVGDWGGSVPTARGDGIGVRRGNAWYLRDSLGGGGADYAFRYGKASDVPVVANWNGPGSPNVLEGAKVGIGAVRARDWHVRRDASGGRPHASFVYGY